MSDSIRLLETIEAYVATAGMAESTFGAKAVNDGKLVPRLRAGCSITIETAAKVRAFIKKNPVKKRRRA